MDDEKYSYLQGPDAAFVAIGTLTGTGMRLHLTGLSSCPGEIESRLMSYGDSPETMTRFGELAIMSSFPRKRTGLPHQGSLLVSVLFTRHPNNALPVVMAIKVLPRAPRQANATLLITSSPPGQ